MLSMWQILIVLGILLLFFGPSRLEKLGPSLGKAIRGFKKGLEDSGSDSEDKDSKTVETSEKKSLDGPSKDKTES